MCVCVYIYVCVCVCVCVKLLLILPLYKANLWNVCSAESTWTVIWLTSFYCYFEDGKGVN